jgi:hypothetical protein
MIGLANLFGGTRRGRAIGSLAAAVMAMALVAPASATILERYSWVDEPFEFVIDDLCDFDIEVEGSTSGMHLIRQGQGPSAPVFFKYSREVWQETWTANNVSLFWSASQTQVRTRATATDDPTIFLVHRILAGHGTFEREDGTVVVREGGIFKVSFLWDTATDQFVELVSFDMRGRFPDVDLCAEFG